MATLDIRVDSRELQDGIYGVDLGGEVDVYTSPRVKEVITALIDDGHERIVISLKNVRYIDSTGLGVLIGALKRVREAGGGINLVCTNPQIKKIFDITGLVKIFGIYESDADAIAALVALPTQ